MRFKLTKTAAAFTLLPLLAGGFMLQRRDSTDAAQLFRQVFARVASEGVDSLSVDAMYEKAARGLVRNLNDPYADLYSPAQLASFSRNALGNAYGGVGMLIEDQQGVFTVAKVYPNTPAEAGGVQLGDRIVAVDDVSTSGSKLEDVSGRLTGTPGTTVRVRFTRSGVAQAIATQFTRARVSIPAVPYALMLEDRIGYVPLQRFSESSGAEVERAVQRLSAQGARGFVLDLRGNGGGDFDESLRISNLFLARGEEIVGVRSRGTPPAVTSRAVRDPLVPTAPLVVLTDGYSASASEIVAGSLQDHDRAVIIGTTSFGKGLVQTLFTLDGGWALKLTTGKWYTPSGRSIQRERIVREDGRLVEAIPDSLETDSVRASRPAFKSDVGRLVYGGGGITPDLIVPADTVSSAEQTFIRALAPKSQQSYIALYELSLELKGSVARDFTVRPEWRDRLYERLTGIGVKLTRAEYDAAAPFIDRMIESRVSNMAFGDSTAFRRGIAFDSQLRRALDLLKTGRPQRELFAVVASARRDG
jgi:carboxyl-terminal processing protease